MITIGGFIHRKEVEDLFWRWFHGKVRESDPEYVTKLILLNNVYVSRYLNLWSRQLFSALAQSDAREVAIYTKAELKDALVSYPHYHNEHVDELIRAYVAHRERYYLETPIHGKLYFAGRGAEHRLVGTSRMKRARRLAEKSARRIIDMIFDAIKMRAQAYADIRAKQFGIPRSQLVSSAAEMTREFERAEQRIIEDLREGITFPKVSAPPINDVAGVKVFIERGDEDRLIEYIESRTQCEIIEKEEHNAKHYNATNLIIRARPNKDLICATPLETTLIERMRAKGIWLGDAQKDFESFVYSGEDDVFVEIIYSSFEDILESEIGKSMHEDRISDQRQRQEYNSHLARNIEYLVQYIFAFSSFPDKKLSEIPIKVWTRYLPDYFDEIMKNLYNAQDIDFQ
ncbi:MAG: hypothetical protein ACOX8U_08925 [Bradymonadia bacterium]|jgi:hypothetical protein